LVSLFARHVLAFNSFFDDLMAIFLVRDIGRSGEDYFGWVDTTEFKHNLNRYIDRSHRFLCDKKISQSRKKLYFQTFDWIKFSWIINYNSSNLWKIFEGMTTMLTLVTSSIASREKSPKVSYIHARDLWIAFCICFIFASLIEFAIVSFIYRGARNLQQKVKSLQRQLSALRSVSSSTDSMITISKYLDIEVFNLNITRISVQFTANYKIK
jgi:hypothetical protein